MNIEGIGSRRSLGFYRYLNCSRWEGGILFTLTRNTRHWSSKFPLTLLIFIWHFKREVHSDSETWTLRRMYLELLVLFYEAYTILISRFR